MNADTFYFAELIKALADIGRCVGLSTLKVIHDDVAAGKWKIPDALAPVREILSAADVMCGAISAANTEMTK